MKPTGIMDCLAPWFIPLFCFLAGYYLNTVIEVKIKPVTSLEKHENYHQYLSKVRANPNQD